MSSKKPGKKLFDVILGIFLVSWISSDSGSSKSRDLLGFFFEGVNLEFFLEAGLERRPASLSSDFFGLLAEGFLDFRFLGVKFKGCTSGESLVSKKFLSVC